MFLCGEVEFNFEFFFILVRSLLNLYLCRVEGRVVDEWVFLCIGFFFNTMEIFFARDWDEFGGKDLFRGMYSVNLCGNGCLNIA